MPATTGTGPRRLRQLQSLISRRRARLATTGLVTAGLAAALLIPGVHDAYPTTRVLQDSGLAWMTSDQIGSLTLVDGVAGQPVVNVPVTPAHADLLQAAQAGPTGLALDEATGRLTRIDGSSYTPLTAAGPPTDGGTSLQLLAGTHSVYVVDGKLGTVAVYDLATLRQAAVLPFAQGTSAYTAIVDASSTLWVLDQDSGRLAWFTGTTARHSIRAFTPRRATLVLADGEPVVIDGGTRRAYLIGPNGSVKARLALGPDTGSGTRYSGATAQETLLVTDSTLGTYRICAFSVGACGGATHAGFGGDTLGPAVTAAGRAFVPDYSTGTVWVLDPSGTMPAVRTGQLTAAGPFDLFSRGGLVFYNDPHTSQAGTIAPDGMPAPIAKYSPATPVSRPSPSAVPSTVKTSPRPAVSRARTSAGPRPSAPTPAPTVPSRSASPKPSGTPSGTASPRPGPSGPPTPTPAPTNTGGPPASCSPGSSSSLSDQGGIPLSNADQPSGGQPQPTQPTQRTQRTQRTQSAARQTQSTGRTKGEWGAAKIAIVTAIITGVIGGIFAVIAAVIPTILPWHPEQGASSTPTSTSAGSGPTVTRPAPSPGVSIPASPARTLTDPDGTGVYGVAFTRSGTLATGDLNGSAYLWNVAKDAVTDTFPDSNRQGIFGVAISPDGKMLAADTLNDPTYSKGAVILWNTSADKPIATLTAPGGRGFGNPPALSPDDATVAAANADGNIYLWDTTTGRPVGKPLTDPGTGVVYGIAFSPATGFLAAADHNGTAYLWNTKQARIVRIFQDPASRGVNGVAFSPDGSILATGDLNGNVYLWNAATGRAMATLRGPKGGGTIQSIAFGPLRGIVAATSDNGTDHKYVTCVWDLTGKPLATLQDPNSAGATRVAFSPDGSILAVGDENAHTYIWDMNGFSA